MYIWLLALPSKEFAHPDINKYIESRLFSRKVSWRKGKKVVSLDAILNHFSGAFLPFFFFVWPDFYLDRHKYTIFLRVSSPLAHSKQDCVSNYLKMKCDKLFLRSFILCWSSTNQRCHGKEQSWINLLTRKPSTESKYTNNIVTFLSNSYYLSHFPLLLLHRRIWQRKIVKLHRRWMNKT